MPTMPPDTTPDQPWQYPRIPDEARSFILIIVVLLLFAAAGFAVAWLLVVPPMFAGPEPPANMRIAALIGSLLTGGFFLTVLSSLFLLLFARAPRKAEPVYDAVPATVAGEPFVVQYVRSRGGMQRTMVGRGTVQFGPSALIVHGQMTANPLLTLGVCALFGTLTAYFSLYFAVGLIAALVGTHYLDRKQITLQLPYEQFTRLEVFHTLVHLDGPGVPPRFGFSVASADGERLYRELLPRFPEALKGWTG